MPLTLGHEPIGIVQAVGERVRASIGRQVLVNPWIGCGQCWACRSDRDNLCNTMRTLGMGAQGAFSTHLLVPHSRYLVDAEGLDPATAAVRPVPASPPIPRCRSSARWRQTTGLRWSAAAASA